jgi:bifunctional non-homologous end joining protein LigD
MAKLATYRAKRDFSVTSEPAGGDGEGQGNRFVVQKHDARRLHYDFRLELDGVLKSWAVTRGPSLVPGEKRLAVAVEDHPLEYGDFEGIIPQGEYGGGTVIVWDRGTWTPEGDPRKGLKKGHLDFSLSGEKLGGRWHLVRMKPKPKEKRENWLLIKADDAAARTPEAPDILEERPDSVKSGRGTEAVAAQPEAVWSSVEPLPAPSPGPKAIPGARKAALPAFVEPALASLVSKPPGGARWVHEIKFDGYRLQARIDAGKVRLITRGGLDWTDKFGKEIAAALAALPAKTALIDGELVVEASSGASDFSAMQADLAEGRTDRFVYYAFDLLHLDGFDLRGLPLAQRKSLLAQRLEGASPRIRFSADFSESGEIVLRHACRLSLEGVVSKRADAPYRSGRGKTWVKSKCTARQECVIGGYVPSTTIPKAIGSLVMGVFENDALRHVGRVGTGYTATLAKNLFHRLEPLAVPKSPFAERLTAAEAKDVVFVRPEFVAEVEFRGWTADGNLRHAAFRGLRDDKPATEVVRETPPGKTPPPPKPQKRTVPLTHPDRLYWPNAGVTKAGLADYYAEVWSRIAPFVVGRPLALLRAPSGITGQMFFQKHAWTGANRRIARVPDPQEPGGQPLLAIDDLDGLIALVQSGVLEIHPWGSTLADWEHPDMLVVDLDPGDDVPWNAVIAAAVETRSRLEAFGLAAFVKTSGGKGLHVVAPLKPKADWIAAKAFAKALAETMARENSDAFVATITKSKRRGKILVDYLRNQRGATAVAPYSTRARPGAPVSMPLAWNELSPAVGPAYFTVENAAARLAALDTDPWAEFRSAARPLPET